MLDLSITFEWKNDAEIKRIIKRFSIAYNEFDLNNKTQSQSKCPFRSKEYKKVNEILKS